MAIYCNKCGARHECSVCPVCAGFGLSNLQVAAGVGKSFQSIDELRAKFEAWYVENAFDYPSNPIGSRECGLQWKVWQAAYASRDAEVEALRKDAERYRWLRDRVTGSDGKPFICVFHGSFGLWSDEYADQAIDDAMREESK